MVRYIPVPEVVWLIAILIAKYTGGINTNGRYNDFIENSTWIIPGIIIFIIWLTQKNGVGYMNYFNLRLFLSSLILGHFFFNSWASAYSPQGPGSGTIYLVGLIITFVFSLIYLVISSFRKI